jgi:ABC-type nitrate/sulfonate/bicarbonate transport system permease component
VERAATKPVPTTPSSLARGALWLPRRLWQSEPLLALIVIVGGWSIIHSLGFFREEFWPSIPQIYTAAVEDWSRLLGAARSSLSAAFLGYLIGFVAAIPVGMLVGRYRRAQLWFSGMIDFLRAIPAVAVIPLALLIFANHFMVGLFVVAYACFFVSVVNIMVGVRHLSTTLESAVRTFGGNEVQVLTKVGVPSLLPFFLASLRQNVAVALIVIVVSDMALGLSGLGLYILQAQGRAQLERMYAAITFVSVVGYLGYRLLAFLEERLFPWWSQEKKMMV